MIKILTSRCTECGAMSMVVDSDVISAVNLPSAGEDQEPLSRCGLIYETDSGEESCGGAVYVLGYMTLKPSF